jgi:crossover junction endodeoxyribonuclease RusA
VSDPSIYNYFTVMGTPAPQGSKRHVGRGILVESSKKVAPWREAVKWEAIRVHGGKPPLEGPLYVSVHFYVRPPKKLKNGQQPITRTNGDIDKLLRSTFDALVDSGMIRDDSQIVCVTARKEFASDTTPPQAMIGIGPQT